MKVKGIVNSVKFFGKKYSPELLLGAGLVGVVAGTVLACKSTLEVKDILDEYHDNKDQIEEGIALNEEGEINYPVEVSKKDMRVLNMRTTGELVKLYAPSVTLMGVSISCILASYKIMNKRNVALMAAYKVMEEAFTTYRGRVVKELGETKDAHFMYGTETIAEEETIIDENGKKKKVIKEHEELVPGAKLSGFARMFEAEQPDQHGSWTGSTTWSKVHDYNLSFLQAKEEHFNNQLVVQGHVTLNEVLSELGFPQTELGMIVGWRYKSGKGDDRISFRPRGIDGNWATGRDGDSIVLDFNVEGVIFDQNVARKELK